VVGPEFLEWVIADDIAVEHKKQSFFIALPQNLLGQLEGAGRAQSHLFLGVGDFELILLLEVFEGAPDVVRLVVDGDDHLDHSDPCAGLSSTMLYLDLMLHHWSVREGERGFGVVYGEGTHAGAVPAHQDQCLHWELLYTATTAHSQPYQNRIEYMGMMTGWYHWSEVSMFLLLRETL